MERPENRGDMISLIGSCQNFCGRIFEPIEGSLEMFLGMQLARSYKFFCITFG